MNNKTLIFLIIVIALLLRFYMLGSVPVGLSSDEASLGYNAYSILKTGKDEYGVNYPLAFKAFGEYKAPLYIYSVIPSIFLFDLLEFSVRLPAAVFGLLTVIGVYLLVLSLFLNKKTALLSALIVAFIPWHLQFTRIAYEGGLSLFLLTYASLFFVKSFTKSKYLVISSLLFALTFYSHYSVRVFIPLFMLSLIIIYRQKIVNNNKKLLSLITFILILLPILPNLFSSAGLSRAKYISFTTDTGIIFSINEKRAEHQWSKFKIIIPAYIIHNKAIDYSKNFIENYLAHFDFTFLFIKGDEDKIFRTPYSGLLLISFLPFLGIGLYRMIKEKNNNKWIVISWLFLSPIASSLTRLSASANRSFMMVIPLSVMTAFGLDYVFKYLKHNKKTLLIPVILAVFLSEFLIYFDGYYVHSEIKNAGDRRMGSKEIFGNLQEIVQKNNYEKVWISNDAGDYINVLFFLKYPPDLYQNYVRTSQLDEFGFAIVNGFDKYYFGQIPKYYDLSKNILYFATEAGAPKDLKPLTQNYFPDGRIKFKIYDTSGVSSQCPQCNILFKPEDLDMYGNKINLE